MKKKLPNKEQARRFVRQALDDGMLQKKPCEVCGDMKVLAHHTDYSMPVMIMWLCHKHHSKWHRENGYPIGEENYRFVRVSPEFHKKLKADSKKTKIPLKHLLEKFYKPTVK